MIRQTRLVFCKMCPNSTNALTPETMVGTIEPPAEAIINLTAPFLPYENNPLSNNIIAMQENFENEANNEEITETTNNSLNQE